MLFYIRTSIKDPFFEQEKLNNPSRGGPELNKRPGAYSISYGHGAYSISYGHGVVYDINNRPQLASGQCASVLNPCAEHSFTEQFDVEKGIFLLERRRFIYRALSGICGRGLKIENRGNRGIHNNQPTAEIGAKLKNRAPLCPAPWSN